MSNQQQQQVPIEDSEEPSEEGRQTASIIADMRSKQLNFLDESGKSVIERIATFLAILFAVTAFSNNFPPAYLKGNLPAKIMVIITLVLYLAAMGAGILAVQPRNYNISLYNMTRAAKELGKITSYKMRWLRVAGVLFALGCLSLAVLIISIIWNV